MKRKILVLLLTFVMLCTYCLPALAAKPDGFTEEYSTDFEDGETLPEDFFTYFNVYDVKEENIKTEDGNTYYNGTFPSGAYLYSLYEVIDYRLEFDIKTAVPGNAAENCYKSALALHVPSQSIGLLIEPDNADSDLSSFLGSGGIFLYFWDNILEVAVHSNKDGGTAGPINGDATKTEVKKAADRMFGVYSVSYQFQMEDGINFSDFTSIAVQEEDAVISVFVKDKLVCSIAMSEPENVTTVCLDSCWDQTYAGEELFSGDSYRKIEIKDASGETKATVEGGVVPVNGNFAFANRANNYGLDNLHVYEKTAEKPPVTEPTAKPTGEAATPTATASAATPTATSSSADADSDSSSNWLIYVLIAAIGAAAVVFVIVIVKHKKKV